METERVYVATGEQLVVLSKSATGSWDASVKLTDLGIMNVAMDPLLPARVYAGSPGTGVFRSDDSGESWRRLSGDGAPTNAFSIAVSASWRANGDGTVLVGCEPSAIHVSEDGGERWRELDALRSIPSASTWSFPPRPWTSHVRWLATSPHDAGLILAGIELGGVMRSTDHGVTWQDHRPGAHRDTHALAIHPSAPSRAYQVAGDGGPAASLDDGESWKAAPEGITRRYGWALAVDPFNPDLWYVSASPGPYQAHHAVGIADSVIYRRRGEQPWEVVGNGLPSPSDSLVATLATDRRRAGLLYAGVRSGSVYRSADHGDTWERLPIDLPGVEAMVC